MASGILVSQQQGIKPMAPALEGRFQLMDNQGSPSLVFYFFNVNFKMIFFFYIWYFIGSIKKCNWFLWFNLLSCYLEEFIYWVPVAIVWSLKLIMPLKEHFSMTYLKDASQFNILSPNNICLNILSSQKQLAFT